MVCGAIQMPLKKNNDSQSDAHRYLIVKVNNFFFLVDIKKHLKFKIIHFKYNFNILGTAESIRT